MIAELKAMGFRVSLWESPYVPLDSAMYAEGEGQGFFLTTKQGKTALVQGFAKPSAAVDFTNPGAVEWFKEKNRALLGIGVAVMKTDFAEDMPDDAVAHDGTPARSCTTSIRSSTSGPCSKPLRRCTATAWCGGGQGTPARNGTRCSGVVTPVAPLRTWRPAFAAR